MTKKSWLLTVGDDGVITIPDELLEETGWDDETSLSWEFDENGSITLTQHLDDPNKASPESDS
jgi:bifunctional DNA-binding transcriptional regulator/antitoxin component of YhaV-PrlF toxin-antitoxin module